MAFWDSSAIVPLCCVQAATARARRLRAELGSSVVWWGTTIEARSAIARLLQEASLTGEEHAAANASLGQLRVSWNEVLPTEKVRSLAEELPDTHGLRAGDALQLAAALVWCRERPKNRPFVCFDRRLGAAAAALGFSVRQ